jgi:hypothetical protein
MINAPEDGALLLSLPVRPDLPDVLYTQLTLASVADMLNAGILNPCELLRALGALVL